MTNSQQLGLIIGMVTMAGAAVAMVTVGIVTATPAFVVSGSAVFAGGGSMAAAASRQAARR